MIIVLRSFWLDMLPQSTDKEEAVKLADEIGYPVMIKVDYPGRLKFTAISMIGSTALAVIWL